VWYSVLNQAPILVLGVDTLRAPKGECVMSRRLRESYTELHKCKFMCVIDLSRGSHFCCTRMQKVTWPVFQARIRLLFSTTHSGLPSGMAYIQVPCFWIQLCCRAKNRIFEKSSTTTPTSSGTHHKYLYCSAESRTRSCTGILWYNCTT
jgi:hypothetical protein